MSLPQKQKEEKEFRHYMACRERRTSEFTRHQSDHSAKPYTHFLNISTRACVITAHAMALSVMTEELTMKTMKLNIDLGKYVIIGTKHDLILSERELSKAKCRKALSRISYYSKFEHLVKRNYATVKSCYLRRRRYRIFSSISRTLGVSLSMAVDQFVEVNHERTCIQSRHSSGRNDYSPTRKANAIERNCLKEILFHQ